MKEALTVLGSIAFEEGNLAEARERLQATVSVARKMSAPASLAHSLSRWPRPARRWVTSPPRGSPRSRRASCMPRSAVPNTLK